jgi:hypothetical protein
MEADLQLVIVIEGKPPGTTFACAPVDVTMTVNHDVWFSSFLSKRNRTFQNFFLERRGKMVNFYSTKAP